MLVFGCCFSFALVYIMICVITFSRHKGGLNLNFLKRIHRVSVDFFFLFLHCDTLIICLSVKTISDNVN